MTTLTKLAATNLRNSLLEAKKSVEAELSRSQIEQMKLQSHVDTLHKALAAIGAGMDLLGMVPTAEA